MTVPRTDRRPLARPDTEGPAAGGAATGADSAFGRFEAGPVQPVREKRGPGAAILLVLAPLLCCGGPLLLGVLATAGAATLGTVGGVVAGLIAVTAVGLWYRRRRQASADCCPPGGKAWGR
jgi:hypothetical protein